jgi:Rrf2 family iron-sulfur cluster assembly transcriptional regulator
MSFLSKGSVYALRAAVYVATNEEQDRFVAIRQIAEKLDISFHFLTKLLQQLTECGIMVSYRGPTGGVALARPADKIAVIDIIEGIQGRGVLKDCILGLEGCGERTPCPLHAKWAAERARIRGFFEDARLSDLARQVSARKSRLTNDDRLLARPTTH